MIDTKLLIILTIVLGAILALTLLNNLVLLSIFIPTK